MFKEPVSFVTFVLGTFACGAWAGIFAKSTSTEWQAVSALAFAIPPLGVMAGAILRRIGSMMFASICAQLLITIVAGFLAIYQLG